VDDVMDVPVGRPAVTDTIPASGARGPSVEVRGLHFGYGDGPLVLDDIGFSVQSGEVVGVFGMTGAGKSTLLSVLSRVHDPPAGTVFMDGVDVTAVPIRDHWRRLAYVTQEPYLFSRSVRANITWRRDEETVDEEALATVLADAALEPDLGALPDGLATVVGERGVTLSGGQRQRVALARAFFRDHDLLLLDDVLSAVDHATEERLVDAIYARTTGANGQRRTAIVVSHRLSVLARADRVLVFRDGRIVDSGPHAELVERRGGIYRRAWEHQQAADRLAALEGGDLG
jgi:ATP-binding cassette subfamily B protein